MKKVIMFFANAWICFFVWCFLIMIVILFSFIVFRPYSGTGKFWLPEHYTLITSDDTDSAVKQKFGDRKIFKVVSFEQYQKSFLDSENLVIPTSNGYVLYAARQGSWVYESQQLFGLGTEGKTTTKYSGKNDVYFCTNFNVAMMYVIIFWGMFLCGAVCIFSNIFSQVARDFFCKPAVEYVASGL